MYGKITKIVSKNAIFSNMKIAFWGRLEYGKTMFLYKWIFSQSYVRKNINNHASLQIASRSLFGLHNIENEPDNLNDSWH